MIIAWMINSPCLLPPRIIIRIIIVIIFSYDYGIIEPMKIYLFLRTFRLLEHLTVCLSHIFIITLAPSATHYTKDIIEHS